jgi:carboxyl-terminal processing protease
VVLLFFLLLVPSLNAAPGLAPKVDDPRLARQNRRHRDDALREKVLKLKPSAALDIYEEVLLKLRTSYVDRDRVELAALFQEGLREMRAALDDDGFVHTYLIGAGDPQPLKDLLDRLALAAPHIETEAEAREEVFKIALAAGPALKLRSPSVVAAVVLEFAWGACNSLDEYTFGLTPRQYGDLQAALRGRAVGVGLKLKAAEGRLVVASIQPDSPALDQLKPGERVLRIDGQTVDAALPDLANARLFGEEGTSMEMEVATAGEPGKSHVVRLQRGAFAVRSVSEPVLLSEGIGYLRVTRFSDTTVGEMKSALLLLQSRGIKVLILDLRGNPGGVFRAGVQAAELFLTDGVIVHTQGRQKDEAHKARNPAALSLPLVVLIDADTASTAEVVAGALKENGRAAVVGQTSFGKGCLQEVLPLKKFPDKMPAGLRITVARFLSPTQVAYTGHGVTPDVAIDAADGEDAAYNAALQAARAKLDHLGDLMPPMPMPMHMPTGMMMN